MHHLCAGLEAGGVELQGGEGLAVAPPARGQRGHGAQRRGVALAWVDGGGVGGI